MAASGVVTGFEESRAAQGGGLGQANAAQGAAVALGFERGGRGGGLRERGAQGGERADREGAHGGVEFHGGAEGGGRVEDQAGRDAQAEHFLEAERLGAELHVVVGPAARGAFFVFDGAGLDDARGLGRVAADLDEIGFAGEAESVGVKREGAEEFPTGAVFVAGSVDGLVGEVAEGGVLVVHEDALGVDEVGSPLTVELVVEGAEGMTVASGFMRAMGEAAGCGRYQQIFRPWET